MAQAAVSDESDELMVRFHREVWSEPNRRGDQGIYARGWVGQVDPELAMYACAVGYASPEGSWPAPFAESLEAVRGIVERFRAVRIEPTQKDVTAEVAALIELQSMHSEGVA